MSSGVRLVLEPIDLGSLDRRGEVDATLVEQLADH